MWWSAMLILMWWCGASAIPSPGPVAAMELPILAPEEWRCPEITNQPIVECSCDMPHTLRCTGDKSAIGIIGK